MQKHLRNKTKKCKADVTNENYSRLRNLTRCVHLTVTSAENVKQGKYPETAHQTERRNSHGGLTHITDSAYEFFKDLETACQEAQTLTNGLLQGSAVLRHSYHAILGDQHLRQKLVNLFPTDLSLDQRLMSELWELLLKKHMPPVNNTYRLRLQEALTKCKELALRTRVAATSETSQEKRKRQASKVSWKQTKIINDSC